MWFSLPPAPQHAAPTAAGQGPRLLLLSFSIPRPHFCFFGSRALCSSRRPLKHLYFWVRVGWSTILRVYSKGARRGRFLPRRGADMHASAAVVATATVSIAVRSLALLFTVSFHISPFACNVPMILRGLFEVSSATADLPRRGAVMHTSTAVVATAALLFAVRSVALLFTVALERSYLWVRVQGQ